MRFWKWFLENIKEKKSDLKFGILVAMELMILLFVLEFLAQLIKYYVTPFIVIGILFYLAHVIYLVEVVNDEK